VNVQPSGWSRIYPNAKNPLTSTLSAAFHLPRDVPPGFSRLLGKMDRRPKPPRDQAIDA